LEVPSVEAIATITNKFQLSRKPEDFFRVRYQLIFLLLTYSGARAGELPGLLFKDVTWDNNSNGIGEIRIPTLKQGKNKILPHRRIDFHSQVLSRHWVFYLSLVKPHPDKPVFFNPETGRSISYKTVYRAVHVLSQGKFHPHQLRHFFATQVYDDTGDLLSVQQLLGHRSVRNTQIYSQLSPKRKRSASHQLHTNLDKFFSPVAGRPMGVRFYAETDITPENPVVARLIKSAKRGLMDRIEAAIIAEQDKFSKAYLKMVTSELQKINRSLFPKLSRRGGST
jgi:hypothetical protein